MSGLTIAGAGRDTPAACAPNARKTSVRVRRAGHSFGRPLSFTVRSHFGEIQRREELGGWFGWLCGVRTVADSVVLQASSFGATGVRVRPWARSALGVKWLRLPGVKTWVGERATRLTNEDRLKRLRRRHAAAQLDR